MKNEIMENEIMEKVNYEWETAMEKLEKIYNYIIEYEYKCSLIHGVITVELEHTFVEVWYSFSDQTFYVEITEYNKLIAFKNLSQFESIFDDIINNPIYN